MRNFADRFPPPVLVSSCSTLRPQRPIDHRPLHAPLIRGPEGALAGVQCDVCVAQHAFMELLREIAIDVASLPLVAPKTFVSGHEVPWV